jgi:hypothetical protein
MLTKAMLAAEKSYRASVSPVDLCLAMTSGADVGQGTYRVLPALGWTQRGSVILVGFLLRAIEDKMVGSLAWTLPWTEANAPKIVSLLTHLGWDGRLYPFDADPEAISEEGWPSETEDVRGLRYLMAARKVKATMVFPPRPDGNNVLKIDVTRRVGVEFPLDPAAGVPPIANPALRVRLAELVGRDYVFTGVTLAEIPQAVPAPGLVELLLTPAEEQAPREPVKDEGPEAGHQGRGRLG